MTRVMLPQLLFTFFSLSLVASSNALDTITTSQTLTDNGTTIVSSDGTFELGFFSFQQAPQYRYLGVWYKKIPVPTYVWIANRDTPIANTSGVLSLTQQGILTVSSTAASNRVLLWSSSSNSTSFGSLPNPVAQLLDSGNLVVRDEGDDVPENYLWQSFDFPGDTLMPGMKLGKNFVTGINRVFWSWSSSSDPSRGYFSYFMNPSGLPQEFLFNGSVKRYRTGPWNGLRWSGAPSSNQNPIYTFEFVYDQIEVYYKFELLNSSVYSRVVLGSDGIINRFNWNYREQRWGVYVTVPADNCDNYGFCHANGICNINQNPVCGCLDRFVAKAPGDWSTGDWYGGCVRRTNLSCHSDGFNKYSNIKVPDTQLSWYDASMSLADCEKMCQRNCSCSAYTNLDVRNGGTGCLLWFGDLLDIRQVNEYGQDIYIRMASSELDGTGSQIDSKNKKVKLKVVLSAVGVGLVLALSLALFVWSKRKREQQQHQLHEPRQQELVQKEGNGHSSKSHYTNESQSEDMELPLLEFSKVARAAGNFSPNSKLGEGGFGPVYKGVLEDEQEVAIKRLSKYSSQGLHEFTNEVMFIAKLQHRNLVRLLGCSIQGHEKLLVYEYMPNKSLDSFIFDQTRRKLLDWPKRFNIINGIARGLLYLHQDSRLRIIHRDLKASNVLLDEDMNAKISDFGTAKSFGGNETEGNTQKVVGTYGYMSPEYAVDGIFSVKSDVFSFGVLVLEIVSGKRNRGFLHREHHHNLLGHAWILHKEGKSAELIDSDMAETCDLPGVLRSIHIGLLCVQQNPDDRPDMSNVILMLGGEGALPNPKEPGFFTERNLLFETSYTSSDQASFSAMEHSITLVDTR